MKPGEFYRSEKGDVFEVIKVELEAKHHYVLHVHYLGEVGVVFGSYSKRIEKITKESHPEEFL